MGGFFIMKIVGSLVGISTRMVVITYLRDVNTCSSEDFKDISKKKKFHELY